MNNIQNRNRLIPVGMLLLASLAGGRAVFAQGVQMSARQAVQQAIENNRMVQAAMYDVQAKTNLKRTSSDIGRTAVTGMFGQYNSYARADNNITVTQSIPFPTVFAARAALNDAHLKTSELSMAVTQNDVAFRVKATWYHLAYLHALHTWYVRTDSLWRTFARAADVRQRTGESGLLEKVTAEGRYLQAQVQLRQNEADIGIYKKRLSTVLNMDRDVDTEAGQLTPLPLPEADTAAVLNNPQLQWYRQQVEVARREKSVEKNVLAPDLLVGYFNQTLIGTQLAEGSAALATGSNRFQGFQVGVSVPLWFKPQAARVRAAEYSRMSAQNKYEQERRNYTGELEAIVKEIDKQKTAMTYYAESAVPRAELILKQANLGLKGGEIGYVEFIQALNTAAELQVGYLDAVNNYNQAVINLEYLLGQR